jgi:hypothetical protein
LQEVIKAYEGKTEMAALVETARNALEKIKSKK